MTRAGEGINGVLLQKLASLDQVLAELRSLGEVNARFLQDDWRIYLPDFERFRSEILSYVQGNSPGAGRFSNGG